MTSLPTDAVLLKYPKRGANPPKQLERGRIGIRHQSNPISASRHWSLEMEDYSIAMSDADARWLAETLLKKLNEKAGQ